MSVADCALKSRQNSVFVHVCSGAHFTRSAMADEISSKCQAEMSVTKLLETTPHVTKC